MYVNYLAKSNQFYQIITIFEASFKCSLELGRVLMAQT